jgi:hypothetical protein
VTCIYTAVTDEHKLMNNTLQLPLSVWTQFVWSYFTVTDVIRMRLVSSKWNTITRLPDGLPRFCSLKVGLNKKKQHESISQTMSVCQCVNLKLDVLEVQTQEIPTVFVSHPAKYLLSYTKAKRLPLVWTTFRSALGTTTL